MDIFGCCNVTSSCKYWFDYELFNLPNKKTDKAITWSDSESELALYFTRVNLCPERVKSDEISWATKLTVLCHKQVGFVKGSLREDKWTGLPDVVMIEVSPYCPEPGLLTSCSCCFLCRSSVWKSWQPPRPPAHLPLPAIHSHPRPLLRPSPRHQAPLGPVMTCWASTATPLQTTCNQSWPMRTVHRSLWPATPSELPPSSNSKPMDLPQVKEKWALRWLLLALLRPACLHRFWVCLDVCYVGNHCTETCISSVWWWAA